MEVQISTYEEFERQFKRLRKKYKSLREDFKDFVKSLKANPFQGVELKGNVRKIRMQISSKGKGKSGGARILTLNILVNDTEGVDVTLLTIYDKNEMESVNDNFINDLVNKAKGE